MSTLLLVLATFAASAVEMVEALTIVLAVGVTRGWRATAWGGTTALVALTVIVVVLGPAISRLPLAALRVGVGALLLIFGLQWLRKAILRASGYKAQHDEDAIYQEEVDEVSAVAPALAFDWYAFTIAFKGVFLEGLEVAFIVITFGSAQGRVGLAALGAAAALVVVATVGVIVHRPLSRVPENWLKFGVGVMLTSFGTFWSAEGAGVDWPGGEICLVAVIAYVALLSAVLTRVLTMRSHAGRPPGQLAPG
jgi:uncharacterized membrane protein